MDLSSKDDVSTLERSPSAEDVKVDRPGDGDASVSKSVAEKEKDEVEYTDDFFDYPTAITHRILQVSDELLKLRDAIVVERRCLNRETEEVAALKNLDEQLKAHAQLKPQLQYEYEDTASPYEPQESAFMQAERRRQTQQIIQKERYMKQMMEVEKMCSEEFFHLNKTRAKVDQLNREISDWRLANGQATGFNPYPMEIMRSADGSPCLMGGGGPSASIQGRYTVNHKTANAGIRSVPNVSLPVPDLASMSERSIDPGQPWVQTFTRAPLVSKWRSGDTDECLYF